MGGVWRRCLCAVSRLYRLPPPVSQQTAEALVGRAGIKEKARRRGSQHVFCLQTQHVASTFFLLIVPCPSSPSRLRFYFLRFLLHMSVCLSIYLFICYRSLSRDHILLIKSFLSICFYLSFILSIPCFLIFYFLSLKHDPHLTFLQPKITKCISLRLPSPSAFLSTY